jgi:LPXTG-motif cell wall-anchored protein
MIRKLFVAAILTAAPLAATGTAYATPIVPAPVRVAIYLANHNLSPLDVSTSCAGVQTKLYNDHAGNNRVETAEVFIEPANFMSGLGTLVVGPVDVPLMGSVNVTLPYVPGATYNAIAVAKGDPLPVSVNDLIARMQANPPTADNSQLLVSGEGPLPVDCPTPTPKPTPTLPKPCDSKPPVKSDAVVVVPSCKPTSTKPEPTGTPSTTKPTTPGTSEPTTAVSTTTGVTPSGTASSATTVTGTTAAVTTLGATTPAGQALAHTGSDTVALGAAAALLVALGTIAVVSVRRKKAGSHS